MKRKKIGSIITMLLASVMMLTLCACSVNGSNDTKSIETIGFTDLFKKVGTLTEITEQEVDTVYSLTDESKMESVTRIISDAISEEVGISAEDFGTMKTGAPTQASWLHFTGSNASMNLYVNDSDMPADLVCILYSTSGDKYYGYKLNRTIYQNIKEVVHSGEKTELNNQ